MYLDDDHIAGLLCDGASFISCCQQNSTFILQSVITLIQ